MKDLKSEVEKFIIEVNMMMADHYKKNYPSLEVKTLTYKEGTKYFKLLHDRSCWGFISKYDGNFKGALVKEGDLLKAASWNAPAKHARGNILDGTESYSTYGQSYINKKYEK